MSAPVVGAQETLLDKAFTAYHEQRLNDAQTLVAGLLDAAGSGHGGAAATATATGAATDTGRSADRALWLRLRLAIDLGQQQRSDSLVAAINEPRLQEADKPWRAALLQLLGEHAYELKKLSAAEAYLNNALRIGGQQINDETILLFLMRIHYQQHDNEKAIQLARLLWYGKFSPLNRMRGGVSYAALMHGSAPGEVRTIVSEIRLRKDCPRLLYTQATEILLRLLLPQDVEQARRIVEDSLGRSFTQAHGEASFKGGDAADDVEKHAVQLAHEQQQSKLYRERMRVWQAIIVYHLDQARGLALMQEFTLQDYPLLAPYLAQAKQQQDDARAALYQAAHACIAAGDRAQALVLIGEKYKKDSEYLLIALDAGLSVDAALTATGRYEAPVALKIVMRLRATQPQRAADFLRQACMHLQQLQPPTLSPAQVSLFILALQSGDMDAAQRQVCIERLSHVHGKHAALGMWHCQQAQTLQQQHSPAQANEWELALQFLPIEHPWYVVAAEQLALSGLEPLSPGAVLQQPSVAQTQRLEQLIKSLSFIAWSGQTEKHLRCRYLLAQALAQSGAIGEARWCFESLIEYADKTRKERLNNALRTLSQQ